ncbi:hypothetical protein AVEN_210901-1 [Araneus ventricosus]|uniref:Uncharacterized protein n=1 Tax=Araneus ventricosus TaxID=182803 RepID=A0A4Y2ULC1_ARAVE|nr:hypothetical protein AVEN_210901-1 [Araneus ventricosus]
MAEEIDNVFENDQMDIRKPTDTNRCVCKERIVCKSGAFSNRSTKIDCDETSNSSELGIEPAFIELKGKRTNNCTGWGYTRWDRWLMKSFLRKPCGNGFRNGLRGNAFANSLWKVKWQPFRNFLCYLGQQKFS